MNATKPEIDWNDNMAVVRAAFKDGVIPFGFHDYKWARSRRCIVDWESKHRPPTVDVERELYLALRNIVTDSNIESEAYDAGVAAIKLYEQKGKL